MPLLQVLKDQAPIPEIRQNYPSSRPRIERAFNVRSAKPSAMAAMIS